MVLENYPQYKQGEVRNPYPLIGSISYGNWGRYMVSACINFTMFGSTVVYVLIAAQNIAELIPGHTFNFCYIALIIGAVLTPLTWLGTPKDFWGIAVAAALVTGTASLITFIAIFYFTSADTPVKQHKVNLISFFTGYGTIVFGLNGHAAFLTFQADMKEPKKFKLALIIGYMIVALMYIPTTAASFVRYGDKLSDNILETLPQGAANTVASILMTTHLVSGIIIILNPVTQELEHVLKIPEHFTWRRVVSRTLMMVAVLFVAESIPHFSSILALIGGSALSGLTFIFPPLFYMKLCRLHNVTIPLHIRVLLFEIMLLGLSAGVVSTYSAITDLAVNQFTVPCYWDPSRA